MPIQNFTLPKPRNDDDWEIWCKKIFASVYKVPDFQRFETRGKSQKGIDLLARLDNGQIILVQCKRRSTEKQLTKKEAEADYNASGKISPIPHHFIIATTHDKKGLQEWAVAKSNPTAAVYVWADIEDLIAGDTTLRTALYGTADLEAIKVAVKEAQGELKADAANARADAKAVREAMVDKPLAEADEFADAYVNHVTNALDELDLFGVDLPKDARKYKLSVAYISLNLESGSGEQESGPQAATKLLSRGNCRRLLIRGDAGCGKSTLLKWAAIQSRGAVWQKTGDGWSAPIGQRLSEALHGPIDGCPWLVSMDEQVSGLHFQSATPSSACIVDVRLNAPTELPPWFLSTPFLIRLRDCPAGKLPAIADFAKRTANLLGTTPKGWEESLLRAGRALVLLDGIDEVPPKHRAALHHQVKALITQFPDNVYILTTRPLSEGEPEWLDELGFQHTRVAPMSRVDREACIDRWHLAVAEELTRSERTDPRLPELPKKLKAALNDAPEIARLATNPLLCAMICALHRSKNHLPENLNELLESLCAILLYSRERETPEFDLKEFDPKYADLSYEDRKAIVSHLAKYMVMEGESALPRTMVKRKIGEALEQLKGRAVSDADVVLKGLMERSGMLREKSTSTIDFIHNTFREYLAAVRFLDGHEVKTLAKQAHEAGWDNVAVFAAAAAVRNPAFSDELVAAMLPPDPSGSKAPKKRRKIYKDTKAVDAQDALRYKKAVTAVRVASAIRTKLSPNTQRRYEAMKKDLFPPRSLSDAAGLATAGNAVLKFVSFSAKLSPSQQLRCIRTLRLIGTTEAKERLRAFRDTMNIEVIEELAQALDPFEIPAVVDCFTETTESVRTRAARDANELHWRRRVRQAVERQVVSCAALSGRGDIVELDLETCWLTDEAVTALAAKDMGLRALAELTLGGTKVTDVGVKDLASADTGLNALTSLHLFATRLTDEGIKHLARADTGLKALSTLSVWRAQITDAGVKYLTDEDTGLKALTLLHISDTKLTDEGITHLARAGTALKMLNSLMLASEHVTDVGLKTLASADTGLKALTSLTISCTSVTDEGMKHLAHPDTGLKGLDSLCVGRTRVTDVGVKELARSDTGLKVLTKLSLWITDITDAGMKDLARADTGLKSLTSLDVSSTTVTDAGIATVKARWPGIVIVH